MNPPDTCHAKDMLGSRWALWLFWIVPWVAIIGSESMDDSVRTGVWTVAFTVGGAACLVNARRCGRLHCFITGPLYLLAALASLLYGLGLLPLGPHGWNWILSIAAAGSILACCGLEMLFGRYKAGRT